MTIEKLSQFFPLNSIQLLFSPLYLSKASFYVAASESSLKNYTPSPNQIMKRLNLSLLRVEVREPETHVLLSYVLLIQTFFFCVRQFLYKTQKWYWAIVYSWFKFSSDRQKIKYGYLFYIELFTEQNTNNKHCIVNDIHWGDIQ